MPAEQPLEEGARRRRRIDLPRRGSLLREGMKGNVRSHVLAYRHPERSRGIFAIRGQGLTLSPHVPRTSPLFSSVFHPARTLSGSLRSPPSPRGEGLRYGICFSFICFHACPGAFASCHPTVPFSRVQGRFLAALEMTIRGKRYSHFVDFPIGK